MKNYLWILTISSLLSLSACSTPQPQNEPQQPNAEATATATQPASTLTPEPTVKEKPNPTPKPEASGLADIISVETKGQAGAYTFILGVSSPDTGCEQYANWWEILSEDGNLLYRRILAHSHVNEQPFIRSGTSVEIAADQIVWLRVHMHPAGYGGQTFKGTVNSGFQATPFPPDFATQVETMPPLPNGCAF